MSSAKIVAQKPARQGEPGLIVGARARSGLRGATCKQQQGTRAGDERARTIEAYGVEVVMRQR